MFREESGNAAFRFLGRARRKLFSRHQWFIRLDKHGAAPLMPISCDDGTDLFPPSDRFWADPFVCTVDGRNFVFVEEFPYGATKAHISVIEFNTEGKFLASTAVLDRPWHLSYPFIFEWKGTHWMLPEAGASGQLTLYRCVEFPHRWAEERQLLSDLRYADPTLLEFNGRWWLFITVASSGGSLDDQLHLYFAGTPLGPFRPHTRNPVRNGAAGSRPAGAPFRYCGELFRPAQDCSLAYGVRTLIQRIDMLTPDKFSEITLAAIEPGWNRAVLRTHTFNVRGDWRVVDALRHIPR